MAAGAHFLRGDHRHRVVIGKDTRLSGYMMESAMVAGFTSVGMDVVLLGPMPTPGGGDADPLDARRPGRHDLRLAQSLRRQRHQVVRARRLQAQRRRRAGDREAARAGPQARQAGADRARPAHRRRARALRPVRQGHVPRASAPRRAQGRDRLRQRRRLPCRARGAVGAWRRGGPAGRHARRAQHQRRLRFDPSASCCRRRWSRAARTSASRSTAMPTG